jgi:DNA polymerase I-like protein with 3'-5' exonuclease and polymerase domains
MKCPPHFKDKKLTADEAALLKIKEQRPALAPVIDLILDHRHVEKLLQYVNPEKVDADGRLRFGFNVSGTVTDRFSSAANPRGSGYNFQNVVGELHHIFLPDPGYFFLSCDASQIEDRLVKIRTQHPAMIELARKRPWEFDAHTHTAAMMFNRPENEVTKDERQRGKILTHARERCMEAETLANHLAQDGYKFTISECQSMIDAWDRVHAPILDWQHRIRMRVIQQPAGRRRLYSSWGRYIDFCYEQLGDSLYRDAISWLPQHECVMLINQYGLIPLWRLIERDGQCGDPAVIEAIARLIENEKIDASPEYYVNKRSYRSFLSAQIHDELLVQCPWDDLDEAYNVMVFLRASIEREREYDGIALSVPVQFSVGAKCWAKDLEWKRMPSRAEFKDAMLKLKAEKKVVARNTQEEI